MEVKAWKNPWLKDNGRRSMAVVKVSSLNLHGTGKKSGILRQKEVFTTMFKMDISLGKFTWSQSRTFDEFKQLYLRLQEPMLNKKITVF